MSDDLTADDRAWIARELARDPRLTEAMLRRHLQARHYRAREAEAERRAAAKAGVSLDAWRHVQAEQAAMERQARWDRELDNARAALDDEWWTPWRIERHEAYRKAVRYLRVNDPPATITGAARRMRGPHRATLAGWVREGRFERPEDVPDL